MTPIRAVYAGMERVTIRVMGDSLVSQDLNDKDLMQRH